MQTLDTELLAEQKKTSVTPAIKITLTHGITEYVLDTDRIKSLKHYFDPDHVYAKEVEFDNSDGYFTDLDLKGYTAVVSHGLLTKSGKKYAPTSPMTVTWQQLNSAPGHLSCLLTMLGIPDMMELDEASTDYIPAESDTKSVKTLLTEIAGATLACFSHCQAYVIVFDSEDSPMGYCPKDSFRIYTGGTRWAAFKRLIERTGCAWKFPSDGKIHVFVPVTSGETFDYEYSLDSGHPFLSKAKRETVVIPNYIVVQSQKDDDPFYSGYAKDQESIDALKTDTFNGEKRAYYTTRLQAGEADTIAATILKRYQLNSEMGSAEVPIVNCGAELFDFIKVTDKREDDYRTGNIGSISISLNPAKQDYSMRFSLGDPPINQYIKELYSSLKSQSSMKDLDLERLHVKDAYIENLSIDNIDAIWIDPEGNIDLDKIGDTIDSLLDGEYFARARSMHLDAETGLTLQENQVYYIRFTPDTEEKSIRRQDIAPTSPTTGEYWIDTSGVGSVIKRWTGSVWLTIDQDEIDLLNRGVLTTHAKLSSLSVDGLVLLDKVYVDSVAGQYDLINRTDIQAGHLLLSSVVQSEFYRTLSDTEKATYLAKAKTFRQATAPTTGMVAGDFWIDTDDGDKPYTYSATLGWVAAYTQISGGCLTTGVIDCSLVTIQTAGGTTRVELTANGLRGYNAGVLQFEAKTSDGKFYAGAGAVMLDASGLEIKGTSALKFTYGGLYPAYIYSDSYGNLNFGLSGGTRGIFSGGIGFTENVAYIDLPQRTSHPTGAEGRMYLNSSDHNIYAFVNNAWQTLHNY